MFSLLPASTLSPFLLSTGDIALYALSCVGVALALLLHKIQQEHRRRILTLATITAVAIGSMAAYLLCNHVADNTTAGTMIIRSFLFQWIVLYILLHL